MTAPTAITLASRDSLLALAQTIEAASILQGAGFTPQIITLKTAGDLKLDTPLYGDKEGRAFFTRELDDALISHKADAAVHSFKDLPAATVVGISDPIFFSETTGADVLISREIIAPDADANKLIIGTSSLRRIHQLSLAYPAARAETLRGNIVTRLKKLTEADRGINTILIAGAGIERIRRFAEISPESYSAFLTEQIQAHIADELKKFTTYLNQGLFFHYLDEVFFPTAPGQGVLALQIAESVEEADAARIRGCFAEHDKIDRRVMLERSVMTDLETGCHAPLGVSAFYAPQKQYTISACFSRKTETDPVQFSDSVFLRRLVSEKSTQVANEILNPFSTAFFWGIKDAPFTNNLQIHAITAVDQVQLTPAAPQDADFSALFVASPAIISWLRENPRYTKIALYAAGDETARILREEFPHTKVFSPGRGFAATLVELKKSGDTKLLWLGSRGGEARARRIAADTAEIHYLAVYENLPVAAEILCTQYATLRDEALVQKSIHLITSAAAARAFALYTKHTQSPKLIISCFGASAAETLAELGFTPYHVSDARSFTAYLEEIRGNTEQMRKKDNHGS